MNCPHCGQEHPDNFKFCPNTGKTIESQLKACTNKQCPDCGKHILPIESKYCPTCGSNISENLDTSKVFMSFFDIVLGETNIYDIDADDYVKGEMDVDDIWPGQKIIHIDGIEFQGNHMSFNARQSDKKVFTFAIKLDGGKMRFPKSWITIGLKPNDIMLSLEKILCKDGFEWFEFDDPYDGHMAMAYKNIDDGTYLTFVIANDGLLVMNLTEEMKNSAYDYFTKDEEYDDTSDEDNTTANELSCPKCDSTDVEDDGTDYLQYKCNECGNIWGHNDDATCPECGSNDIEDDGTGYLQYECNNCGHVWGDEVDTDEDVIFSKVRSIIVDKLGVDEYEISYDSYFDSDLGADELDIVELIMEFEKEFGISIPDDKAETLYTVGNAIEYIKESL